jgi:Skp family chaperone for outer membrane proteins
LETEKAAKDAGKNIGSVKESLGGVSEESNKTKSGLKGVKDSLSGVSEESTKTKTKIKEVKNALTETGSASGDLKKGLSDVLKEFTGLSLSSLSLAGGVLAVGMALKSVVTQAMEAQRVDATLQAVIKATGQAAGYTADQINDMSVAWMRQTGIDDEVIKSASTVLLTFRAIGRDVFPQAMEAAMNMSAVMGQDLQSSIVQVGKALQEPIEGVSALRRVGVQLTDEQEKLIKSFMEVGDLASAQKIILQELSLEFGGAAKAAGETFAGSLNKLKGEFNNLAEEIGGHLIPVLTNATKAMTLMLSWDDRVRIALNEHAGVTAKTAKSYEDYIAEMQRAAKEAGYAVGINGDLVKVYRRGSEEVEIITQKKYALSKVEYELVQNTDKYNGMIGTQDDIMPRLTEKVIQNTDAVKKQKDEFAKSNEALNLRLMLQGELTKSNERYNEQLNGLNKKLNEYKERIAELEKLPWKTDAQKKELKSLQDGVFDVTNEISNLKVEHDKQTKQWLLNVLQQKLALLGLKDAGLGIITELGKSWGVITDEEYNVLKGIDQIIGSTNNEKELVEKILNYLRNINGTMSKAVVHILTIEETLYITSGQGYEGNQTNLALAGRNRFLQKATGGVVGYPSAAGGASFTVPPGAPGDSAWIRVSSGEQVTVVPQGDKHKQGDQKVTINLNVNSTMDAHMMARQVARVLQGI